MKKHFSLAIAIIVLAFYACQNDELPETDAPAATSDLVTSSENQNSTSVQSSHGSFSKKVGRTISHETGEKWIDNFKRVAKRNSASFVLNPTIVKDLLNDSLCIGISLQFAQDNTGKVMILPIAVDQHGKLMTPENVVAQTGSIAWHTAKEWIANYKGEVSAHFFGADTFSRLLTEDVVKIHLTEAMDDGNNRQLLLSKGKAKGNPNNEDYEDGSWPCPPVCP